MTEEGEKRGRGVGSCFKMGGQNQKVLLLLRRYEISLWEFSVHVHIYSSSKKDKDPYDISTMEMGSL